MKKLWMTVWALAGTYFVVAVAGGGRWIAAAMAMLCGFMVARNMADAIAT